MNIQEKEFELNTQIYFPPSIILFKNGIQVDKFLKEREYKPFFNWINKKLGKGYYEIQSIDEIQQYKEASQGLIVYLGQIAENLELFKEISLQFEEQFLLCEKCEEINKQFPLKIYRDDKIIEYEGQINKLLIANFIKSNKDPNIIELSEKTADRILKENNSDPVVILLYLNKDANKKILKNDFESVAKDLKNQIDFFHFEVNTKKEKVLQFFNITVNELPIVKVLRNDLTDSSISQVNMEGTINEQNIRKFVKEFLESVNNQ